MVERVEEIYQALLNAGISEKDIEEEISEKEIEFQGFMTKPAILYLIAKEHGVKVESNENKQILNYIAEDIIDYKDFTIPISTIIENMSNIVIAGRVNTIYQIRDFTRKDGSIGRVGSFQVCDNSDCIKIVLWDKNVETMENDLFKKGEIIQIIGGYSKKGRDGKLEVHLNRQGNIILAPEDVNLLENTKSDITKSYSTENPNKANKKTTWTIQSLHNKEGFIRFISGIVKVEFFKELTLKNGTKSFLLKLILSDASSSIRVNIWDLKAVECMKLIRGGDMVRLSNVVIKENFYSNQKELNFTQKSILEIL
ncbi:MAG: hypothetical protein ACFFCY_05110 [Promethearchaeota archaeon]